MSPDFSLLDSRRSLRRGLTDEMIRFAKLAAAIHEFLLEDHNLSAFGYGFIERLRPSSPPEYLGCEFFCLLAQSVGLG